ncbi:MAG TPA: 4-hydroxythreonine-4-phosphate dehydrogenase PdxA [Desulfonatronum sp.]|nr:4-hydroxythreonine-4-phosphate dehydrogenase PdxA [Desulfonatronum sp.]
MNSRPNASAVLLTLGDPNGLGPELVCRILPSLQTSSLSLVIIGPEQALQHHAHVLGLQPPWTRLTTMDGLAELPPGIFLFSRPEQAGFALDPGLATLQGGEAAGRSLDTACTLLQKGYARALVTCPLNKAMLQQAGFAFAGHTEFLAARAGLAPEKVCMHFWGPRLRVSLATTHPPLARVPRLISQEVILSKLELTLTLLRAMDHDKPVAVCGLNPHAGEEGKIGDEEIRIIAPAVAAAVAKGWNVVGPLAADTVFHRALQGEFSAVLAMYHDQGLGPFKLLHFHSGIQITLGLPYVRTSPDHGTGYDLVGKGTASVQSLKTALDMAIRLTNLLPHEQGSPS